jgi:hypothetical protein
MPSERFAGDPPAISDPSSAPRHLGRPAGARSQFGRGPDVDGRAWRRALLAGGTEGNERLTVLTGLALIALTAVLGVTIVWIGQLMWLHLFLGLALLGPVALKLASVGYRFLRYYASDSAYRRKGPPVAPLRALAPLLVALTAALWGTGVALLFAGRHTGLPLGLLHKVCFFVWIAVAAVHVLVHLPEILRALTSAGRARRQILAIRAAAGDGGRTDAATAQRVPGGAGRRSALALSLLGGLVLATALIGQFAVWTG